MKNRIKLFILLLLLWVMLSGGNFEQWWLGLGFVAFAVYLDHKIFGAEGREFPIRLIAKIKLFALFIHLSVKGALQVARAATRLRISLQTRFVEIESHIPASEPFARAFFETTLCLMPGTLVADSRASKILLHVLDEPMLNEPEIRRFEKAVLNAFAQTAQDS